MKITGRLYSAHCMLSIAAVTLFLGPLCCSRQSKASHPITKTSTQSGKPAVAAASVNPAAVAQAIRATLAKNALAKTADAEPWIMGDNDRFIPVVGNLEQHLLRAQEAQNSHNNKLVAIELRAAAGALQPERKNLVEPVRPDLVAATNSLNQLATQAESGKTNAQMLRAASISAYDADLHNGLPAMQTDQWLKTYNRPIVRITAARAALSKDAKAAAIELRKAKAYVDIDAARASGTLRQSLDEKTTELSALSDQVAGGKVKDPKEFDHVATDIARALSEFYYHNSKNAWQMHDAVASARWLTASIYNLRQSIYVSGMKIDSSETNSLAATEAFAGNIHSNANVDAKEMDKQIEQTGTELRKFVAMVKSTSERSARLATLARPH